MQCTKSHQANNAIMQQAYKLSKIDSLSYDVNAVYTTNEELHLLHALYTTKAKPQLFRFCPKRNDI